jgi:predicted transposase/invertase (TIGR01784 family)
VEVQGYADPDFAARMFQYYYRILDKYAKPVTAFAIFTDSNKNFSPAFYKHEFLRTKVYYSYNTCKIIDQDDMKLINSNNPFAMAVLSAKIAINSKRDQQLFDMSYDMVRQLLKMQMPKEKIRKVMNFLKYYVRFENPEMCGKFESEILILTERSSTMSIEEFLLDSAEKKGIKKGREEGIRETAIKMKKSGLDIALIANITGLSTDEIEKLK